MEIVVFTLLSVIVVAATHGSRRRRRDPFRRRRKSTNAGYSGRRRSAGSKLRSAKFHGASRGTPPAVGSLVRGLAYIVDGDTIRVNNLPIRLFGVDAPELNHPYGQQAKWALHALCKGKTVRAEIIETDKYGRTVARCRLDDGRDLSAEMVKLGLAIDWPKYSGGRYSHLERPQVRRKLWLADARQKGRMDVWHSFEARQRSSLVRMQHDVR